MAYRVCHTDPFSADWLRIIDFWTGTAELEDNLPVLVGGHFRCHDADAVANHAAFFGLSRGNTNNQAWSVGFLPHNIPANRVLQFHCQEGSTTDTTQDTDVYVEGEWWFIALHIASATARTFYYQRPGDSVLQSFAGSGGSILPTVVDSLLLGGEQADFGNGPMDCFQVGMAIGGSAVTNVLSELQAWADGQAVETISGITHAWPLVGTSGDYDDAIGAADFTADTTNGGPSGITDPFTPSTPSGSVTASPGTLSLSGGELNFLAAQAAVAGQLTLGGGVISTLTDYFDSGPGALNLSGFASFQEHFVTEPASLLLSGGVVNLELGVVFTTDPGVLLLSGTMQPTLGHPADPGTLTLIGGTANFPGSPLLSADRGLLTLSGQETQVDLALQCLPGSLSLLGAELLTTLSQALDPGSLTFIGANAVLISTDQEAVAANPGTLTLGAGTVLFLGTQLLAGGSLSLVGGTADFIASQQAEKGTISLVGGDAIFNTDVVLAAQRGTLSLSGLMTPLITVKADRGVVNLVGANVGLVATQLSEVLALPGVLQLLGTDATFLITGLTWEGDDATWGGSLTLYGEQLPVFVIGNRFYQAGNTEEFDLDPIEVNLERVGLTIIGVDREGKPRSNPGLVKLLSEIWPTIRGVPGTVINIYAGSQNEPEEGVLWQGPFVYIVGQTRSVQPLVEGVYLGVRFHSIGQRPWHLLGYDLEVEVVGSLPQ